MMAFKVGSIINNRYRIVNPLGQGGFGAVYRVWDINLQRPYALKENIETTEEAKHQFFREAQLLSGLTHANLPRVIDHFEIPGQGQYLVMDFVEGEDLQTMLDRQGPLPERQVLEWIKDICDALRFLHSQTPPIVHRDIKPTNILITPQGKAVLVDFGIAKVYTAGQPTTTGARAVTPGFSPPEQYVGGGTTPRSDIYALGATLYTVLTGRKLPESIGRIVSTPSGSKVPAVVIPPRSINPAISIPTSHAIMKAIEPDPAKRFPSISSFQKTLLQSSGHQRTASPQKPPQVDVSYSSGQPQPALYTSRAGHRSQLKSPFRWGAVLVGASVIGLLGIAGAAAPVFILESDGLLGTVIASGIVLVGGIGATIGAFVGQRVSLDDSIFLPRLLVTSVLALASGLALNLLVSLESFSEGPTIIGGIAVCIGSLIGALLGTLLTGADWFRTISSG